MSPIFLNQSCDPFTPQSRDCLIGNYVEYSVNVTGPDDVAVGIKFAQEKNIRLVIKNTGHDYLGKSTGKGALGLWTHNLKSLTLTDHEGPTYTGKAIRMGAGVQAFEAYEFADSHKVRVTGGECSTVGLAGGYTQSGGHSVLSSHVGLAADNALEWEVVTADGRHLTVSETENSDLYWALSGGGGGTYAVVLSLTTKVYEDGPIGGAALSFNASSLSADTYWELISTWQASLPTLIDAGAVLVYQVRNTSFNLISGTFLGSTKEGVNKLLEPFSTKLDSRNVQFSYRATYFPTYLEHFSTYFGPLPDGIYPIAQLLGGRLIPRKVIEQNNSGLTSAIRSTTEDGTFYIGGIALNVNHTIAGNEPGSNSVLPAWRETLLDIQVASDWNFQAPFAEMLDVEDRLTNRIVPMFEEITPGSGTYLSEGDFKLKTWKEDFYGENYERLRAIKRNYDPDDLFYATTAVGSDEWSVREDGRLCRL
ncbi:MAG: hypothetical protein Q9225_005576 [Loekoesia sp. 1 TL-2023]